MGTGGELQGFGRCTGLAQKGEGLCLSGTDLDTLELGKVNKKGLCLITSGPQCPERASNWPRPHRSQWQSFRSSVLSLPGCYSEIYCVSWAAETQALGPWRKESPGSNRKLAASHHSGSRWPHHSLESRGRGWGGHAHWLCDLGQAT